MQEMQVQSLGQEDPLEKEMVALSSILAWRIPWTEEPGGLQSVGVTNLFQIVFPGSFILTLHPLISALVRSLMSETLGLILFCREQGKAGYAVVIMKSSENYGHWVRRVGGLKGEREM